MQNIFSIDLESWVHFYFSALKKDCDISSDEKKKLDSGYIPEAISTLLGLLDKYKQKATFFVLGEVYNWYPEAVRGIVKRGHEIAYHSHTHALIKNGDVLRGELKKSEHFINEFNPAGFRALNIYITRDAMPCLKKHGFRYSSSTYSDYRILNYDGIDEIPVSSWPFRGKHEIDQDLPKNLTIKMLFREIPFGSGLFISLFGARTSCFIERVNKENKPAILFIHPWQVCVPKEISSLAFKLKVLFRNPLCFPYTWNIQKPLETLLSRHSFTSFKELYYS